MTVPGSTGNVFHGPTALIIGDHGTQHIQFVHQGRPAFRVECFPVAASPVSARMLARQPSRLLRAVHQVVPFTGRQEDLEELARWRDDRADRLAVRLVHGPGGQGKTRLAARFAELSRAAGWTVRQAVLDETGADPIATDAVPESAAETGAGTGAESGARTGILLVVDYAERWPTGDLRTLLREPLLHRTGVPVRILLLARPAGIWWESLSTWIGDTLDAPAEAHPLRALAHAPFARAELFRHARDSFAAHLGVPAAEADRVDPPHDLDVDDDYAQVLTIHIVALAAVDARLRQGAAPDSPARASAYLLGRERAHWSALHERASQPLSTTPETMGRTVLTATLTGPLARARGRAVLARVGLADTATDANSLLDDHRYCYPPPHADPGRAVTVLEPLYPDRLGEDFIGLATPADPDQPDMPHPVPGAATDDWAHRAVERLLLAPGDAPADTDADADADADGDADATAPWTRQALTVLIETARRWPHVATGQLYPLLRNHPRLALHAGGSALAALAGLDDVDLTVLEAVAAHFPGGRHTDLDAGIAAVTARLAAHQLARTDVPAARARVNDHLAMRLSHAGLRNQALAAGERAVAIWDGLAAENPAAHDHDLAASLVNVGVFLSDAGRPDEALAAAERAVAIRRRHAAEDPTAHAPDLALALTNLGVQLAESGRPDEALTAIVQAGEIRVRLASDNSPAHAADLAHSLTNLGAVLAELGRPREALAATQQAVKLLEGLAAENPAAHEPQLARSLTNLGNHLSAVGQRDEALTVTEQAVAAYRGPAERNPAAYAPDLAVSLTNLGAMLTELGRPREALAATAEAVELLDALAAENPAAHEPDLAVSLNNLSDLLSAFGHRDEALVMTEQATKVLRALAAENPAAHEPDLASALATLGTRLSEAGRPREALAATEQAVELLYGLAARNPAAYGSDLARSLTRLGIRLAEAGQPAEALAVAQQAVDAYRALVAENPAAHEPLLASALNNLGALLPGAGRDGEALAVTVEAMEILRPLAVEDPVSHDPGLALTLNNLSSRLAEAGRHDEALSAAEQAVAIRRRLAAEDPDVFDPDLALSLTVLAVARARLGEFEAALHLTGEAVEIYRRRITTTPALLPRLVGVLGRQASVLDALGRSEEAAAIRRWAMQNLARLV